MVEQRARTESFEAQRRKGEKTESSHIKECESLTIQQKEVMDDTEFYNYLGEIGIEERTIKLIKGETRFETEKIYTALGIDTRPLKLYSTSSEMITVNICFYIFIFLILFLLFKKLGK